MPATVKIRTDYSAVELRRLAASSKAITHPLAMTHNL